MSMSECAMYVNKLVFTKYELQSHTVTECILWCIGISHDFHLILE